MKKRNYLIGILIVLFVIALAFTSGISFYGRLNGKVLEYRDLAAMFTAVIVSGSFIISTLNTKLSADLNESKLQFDRNKFDSDKRIIACNLFKEYNSEAMVTHNETAVTFMHQNKDLDPLELIVKLNKDVNASKSVTMLLNHLELIAICYRGDIGDKALIQEMFLDIFKLQYSQFDLYIKTKQKKSSNFFDTFEAVVKEWT
ncbi:MAG TPA: DUF4760 domain-containing protein [Puia sp.]|nr:DUF4760 domain-containing protein [Puia sp.]